MRGLPWQTEMYAPPDRNALNSRYSACAQPCEI
jgi:hypothetical protein